MPYDTFRWQGIDGSSVLAYFITTTEPKQEDGGFGTTYNGVLCPSSVMGGWKRYEPKEINRTILMAYGYGDGGGGPDEEMLEMGAAHAARHSRVPEGHAGPCAALL